MKHWKEHATGYLFLAPALVILGTFVVIPIFYSICLSFLSWDMMRPNAKFVGLGNYIKLLTSPDFFHSLSITFLFALLTVPSSLLIALCFSFLLDKGANWSKLLYRSAFISPMLTSTVAISVVWIFIYQPDYGLANEVLGWFGAHPLRWLNSPDTALISLAIMSVWKGLGFSVIVLLAGIQSIPADIEEAARVDGAGLWRTVFGIKLPLLTPSIFLLMILTTIDQFQTFSQVDVMTRGGPAKSTELIVAHLYHYGFERFQMGYASSIAVFILLFTLLMTLIQMQVVGKRVHYQ